MVVLLLRLDIAGVYGYVADVDCRSGAVARDDNVLAICMDRMVRSSEYYPDAEVVAAKILAAAASGSVIEAAALIDDIIDVVTENGVGAVALDNAVCIAVVNDSEVLGTACMRTSNDALLTEIFGTLLLGGICCPRTLSLLIALLATSLLRLATQRCS